MTGGVTDRELDRRMPFLLLSPEDGRDWSEVMLLKSRDWFFSYGHGEDMPEGLYIYIDIYIYIYIYI